MCLFNFSVVVIVFDMSDSKTLRNAVQWKEEARRNAGTDSEDQLLFLVGSKKDLLVSDSISFIL
jgi:hypothetical protein